MPEEVGGIVGRISVKPDDDLQAQLGKLKSALDMVEGELETLHAKFGQTGQSATLLGSQIGDLAAEKLLLKSEIDKVTASLNTNEAAHRKTGMAAEEGRKKTAGFGYQMMALGQTMDDLQYVGEMGLRPIINNIMQISPALGIALISIDVFRKHGDEIGKSLSGIVEFLRSDYSGFFDSMASGFSMLGVSANDFTGAVKDAIEWIKRIPDAWGEISGSTKRATQAMVDDFLKATPNEEEFKKKGKAYEQAITNDYGRGKLLGRFVSPQLAANNPDLAMEETARIAGLVDRVKGGDSEAIKELEEMAKSDPELRDALREADPQTKINQKAEKAIKDKADKVKKRAETRAREMREADEKANRLLHGRREDIIERKIESGEPLSQEELEAMPDKLREKMTDRLETNTKARAKLSERYSDVSQRLYEARNPEKVSQSLAMDQFESTIRGVSGMSEEAKQLAKIADLQEELVRIQGEYKTIGVKKRGGG